MSTPTSHIEYLDAFPPVKGHPANPSFVLSKILTMLAFETQPGEARHIAETGFESIDGALQTVGMIRTAVDKLEAAYMDVYVERREAVRAEAQAFEDHQAPLVVVPREKLLDPRYRTAARKMRDEAAQKLAALEAKKITFNAEGQALQSRYFECQAEVEQWDGWLKAAEELEAEELEEFDSPLPVDGVSNSERDEAILQGYRDAVAEVQECEQEAAEMRKARSDLAMRRRNSETKVRVLKKLLPTSEGVTATI